MGSESSVLQKFELSEPYNQSKVSAGGEEIKVKDELECSVYPAVRRTDGKAFTLLKFGSGRHGDNTGVKTLIEVLKTRRHPNIIKFFGVIECSRAYWVITEDAVPLQSILENLEDDELISGLCDIIKSFIFLHSKCHLIHNNISVASVFVSNKNRTWKLAGMEKVKQIKENVELVKEDIKMLAKFGLQILDLLQEPDLAVRSLAKKLDSAFLQASGQLVIQDVIELLDEDVFRTNFIEISTFIDDITLKSIEEKETFFKTLTPKLRRMNQEVLTKRLIPLFFSKFILAEPSAEEFFLQNLFSYCGGPIKANSSSEYIVKEPIFKSVCIPIILDLFASRDTHVRLVCLKLLPLYVDAFSRDVLAQDVLPEVLLGLKDQSDEIVSATLKALSCLVTVLGGDVVVGGGRSKHFVDLKPKFKHSTQDSTSEDSSDIGVACDSSPKVIKIDNIKHKKIAEHKKERLLARQNRIQNKMNSPERLAALAERIKASTDTKAEEDEESEPEWEGLAPSSSGSDAEVDEPANSVKERPTATVQPVMMSVESTEDIKHVEPDSEHVEEQPSPETTNTILANMTGSALKLKKSKPGTTLNLKKENKAMPVGKTTPVNTDPSVLYEAQPRYDNIHNEKRGQKYQESRPKVKSLKSPKLGAEFEVEVTVPKKTEVDFFADMQPDIKNTETSRIVIENVLPNVSTKFNVDEGQLNSEVSDAWGHDDWDDFT